MKERRKKKKGYKTFTFEWVEHTPFTWQIEERTIRQKNAPLDRRTHH